MNGFKIVDNVLIVCGFTIALADIQSILGITILIVQFLWILAKTIIRIYHAIKEKNGKELTDSLKDLSDDLTGLKNTLPKQSKEGKDDGK